MADVYGEGYRTISTAAPERERFSWRAVIAGVFVALAAQLLLTTLGLAVGVTALDPDSSAGAVRTASAGVGIWYLVSALIAMFAGGAVAGIAARDGSRLLGAAEGLVVWAVGTVVAGWLLARGIGQLLSFVSGTVSTEAGQAASSLQRVTPDGLSALQPGPGTARQVAGVSTAVAWVAFATLLLSCLTAIGGGVLGATISRKRAARTAGAAWRRDDTRGVPPAMVPREA